MAAKLTEVEITRPLPSVLVDGDYSALWVLVRSRGVPIGYTRIYDCTGLIVPEQLARHIADQLGSDLLKQDLRERLTADLPEEDRYEPFISVQVCTRGRPHTLKATLDSLLAVDYPRFEVLVVENSPTTDETRKLVQQYPFRYVVEPVPGHSWVRNRAIMESAGEIFAVIDDDMIADPGWLRAVADGFSDPEVMCITGLVLPLELETSAQEFFETVYHGLNFGFQRRVLTPGMERTTYWLGTHCAFRRKVFEEVGMFDVALGAPVGGGEDLDMVHRVMRAGYSCLYSTEALRFHKHRDTDEGLRRQLCGYSKAFYALIAKYLMQEPDNRLAIARFAIKCYWRWFIRRAVRRVCRRDPAPLRLIMAEGWAAFSGPWAYWRSAMHVRKLRNGPANHEAYDQAHISPQWSRSSAVAGSTEQNTRQA